MMRLRYQIRRSTIFYGCAAYLWDSEAAAPVIFPELEYFEAVPQSTACSIIPLALRASQAYRITQIGTSTSWADEIEVST